MNEIYNKILELWNMIKEIPEECKGNSEEAHKNRSAWMHVRSIIHQLIKKEDE